ncbi:unnamed protein product [Anisakis simplex]|uniref:Protein real-time (inferred by orthology to a D. melanogaster protein) n=1 Tax=Anisakis simplex TaxID=6269 RepID=A0A0M3JX59_ANISI|nr:unnamed protein product [Anisakis simplex]
MVQTYQSPVRIYKYPFEIVMAAYQKRFPTCPQIPIFVGSEITYEHHSEDGAEEVIERKCQLNVDAPYLVKKIAGVDYVYFTQKNSLDKRKRTLLIEASNISFSNRIVIKENCFYYVHPENSEWTCFEQSASLDVKSFFGFESSVEKLAVKQYAANLAKAFGKEVLEYFIGELIKNGTTYIAPFSDADESAADSAIDVSRSGEGEGEGEEFEKEKQEQQLPTCSAQSRRTSLAQQSVTSARRTSIDDLHSFAALRCICHSLHSYFLNCLLSMLARRYDRNGRKRRSVRFLVAEAKLEAEYIRRFLGQLSALEESRLCELKYGLRNSHKGKLPNDAHLLRFLRAREFDVARASEMIQKSLLWRKQYNVDRILLEFEPPAVLKQFFPGCWHHCDKKGRPLFVLRLGQLDMKGLLRAVGLETIVKYTLSIIEQGLIKTTEATKKLGVPISSWTLLVDLEGLSMRHLWRPGIQALLRIIEIAEAHYPETMGLVLIARAPRVFPVLWTLISPFIDENTRKKFMINSSESVFNELSKYIDEQYLPDFLGGSCLCNAPDGGHVPKNLYRPVAEDIIDDEVLSSTYQSATVYKGIPHEVVVKVPTKGCVLTWDFDVLKSDCEFLLYYTEKVIDTPATPHSPPVLSPVERVTAAIGSSASTPISAISCDSKLTLGIDLRIEEKPVQFTEGDSMQGSHYCSRAGTYILQWRHPEPTPNQSFDFSLSHHKCKIMYYYELLDSADFRYVLIRLFINFFAFL